VADILTLRLASLPFWGKNSVPLQKKNNLNVKVRWTKNWINQMLDVFRPFTTAYI
jgi:hypothetical protein